MLSNTDIEFFFDKLGLIKPNIISYKEIPKEGLDFSVPNVILYEQSPNVGHWVIVFVNNENLIEFFDSYGFMIDDELKFAYYNDKSKNLTKDFIETNEKKFEINDITFQSKNYQTCGMWVSLRYLFDCIGYTKKQFDDFFQSINSENRDDVARVMFEILEEKIF